jgi:hypothetical protein
VSAWYLLFQGFEHDLDQGLGLGLDLEATDPVQEDAPQLVHSKEEMKELHQQQGPAT